MNAGCSLVIGPLEVSCHCVDNDLAFVRGGKIIKEIRETSGANIKILTENELPICALHNDRVVQ